MGYFEPTELSQGEGTVSLDSPLEDFSPLPGVEEWPGREGSSCLSTSARGREKAGANGCCHYECSCAGLWSSQGRARDHSPGSRPLHRLIPITHCPLWRGPLGPETWGLSVTLI